jgi:hypothetical protein
MEGVAAGPVLVGEVVDGAGDRGFDGVAGCGCGRVVAEAVQGADDAHDIGPWVERPSRVSFPCHAQFLGEVRVVEQHVHAALAGVDGCRARQAACQSTTPVSSLWRHRRLPG